ncbi:LytR/AlgR family response regulator transcription factor [Flavobacterium sp.]|uniref:LytR/AlgR family response regulator transcription factor n=1 Tax=Flavobacterium sp. TaxID=239 RepID=UPI004047478B
MIFLDIQLIDGYEFDILDSLENHPPIIFTTVYNEYGIRGFKYNGFDYFLKTIDKRELQRGLEKYRLSTYPKKEILELKIRDFKNLFQKQYKHRFIVNVGNHFSTFNVKDIAFFKS